MSAAPVRAFDSAYPGSMFERNDGYYVERKDVASLAAAMLEQIHARDRDIEDWQATAIRMENALRGLVGVIEAAGLENLTRGVQLGQTVWYVKASDAMAEAHDALGSL